MKKLPKIYFAILICISFAFAQHSEPFAVSVYGNLSQPVGGLSAWFKPTLNYGIGFGRQNENGWYMEGNIEYARYDDENLSGSANGRVDLFLEHTGILFNGDYKLQSLGFAEPFLIVGTGLYYWKGIRGDIQPDLTVDPVIPYIAEKKLEEWNWGFRGGLGVKINLPANLAIDFIAYYRFIVGDLWPTMQPHIELESVSGFQTFNYAVRMRYFFR